MKAQAKRFSFARKPKFFVPAAIVVLLAIIVVSIVRNMNQPAIGQINQEPPAQAEKVDPYASPGAFDGKYVSFKYPAHYKSVKAPLSGDYLEVAEYHSTDATSKQLTVGVHRGSLATEGGVQYRRQHKELYRENNTSYGLEFIKGDGTEDTFYIEHKDLLATVSVTAPYNNQVDDAQYAASSLKWH